MAEQNQSKQLRAHLFISGRVQGVSFRWNTQYQAQTLELTGWVRNTWDGRVEAVFEGEEAAVHKMVKWCRHGARPARVDNVEINYGQPTGEFRSFRIAY